MVFLVTLSTDDLARNQDDLRQNLKFTKAVPSNYGPEEPGAVPLVLFLTDSQPSKSRASHQVVRDRSLVWIGKVGGWNTIGPVDRSITVKPMRECLPPVPLLGTDGLLESLPMPPSAALSHAYRAAASGPARGTSAAYSAPVVALRVTTSGWVSAFTENLGRPRTQPSTHPLHLTAIDLVLPIRPTVNRLHRLGEVTRIGTGIVLRH
ncbi:hypothetical protein ABIA32_006584 [Streptacidiphilus sp. MAP12-20]|uniref:hypothetical protein n=1 Tax=Streptacidiphilus sp. MAP12-20 TaxID=3156299 RepID=UPI0035180011